MALPLGGGSPLTLVQETMTCPNCNSAVIIPIVYGKPGAELMQQAEAGEIKLGGCIVLETCPNRFCKDCSHRWIDESDPKWIEAQGLRKRLRRYQDKKRA